MNLRESDNDFSNGLPGLRLPNPSSPKNANSQNINNPKLKEINDLLKEMEKNEHRTTNFAIILYLSRHKDNKMLLSKIKEKIKKDYKNNNSLFLKSKKNEEFKSESQLQLSISGSISRNKSFIVEQKYDDKLISLQYDKALEYLKKQYKKYVSETSDITSVSSADNDVQSERKVYNTKKFLGFKTARKINANITEMKEIPIDPSVDSNSSITQEHEEKPHSTFKFLKDNLKGKCDNNVNIINNINVIYNGKEFNEMNLNEETDKFNEEFAFLGNNNNTKFESNSMDIISKSINVTNETRKITKTYKNKLVFIKKQVSEREQMKKEYSAFEKNVHKIKNELNTMFRIYELKLDIMKDKRNLKHFDKNIKKKKVDRKIFKETSDDLIGKLKDQLDEMQSLGKKIMDKNKEIDDALKNMKITDSGNNFFGKNEIKKDYDNLCKIIREDSKVIESCEGNSLRNVNCDKIVNDIKAKFNNISRSTFGKKKLSLNKFGN